METNESTVLYREKICKFNDAVHNCSELRGLKHYNSQDGYNDYDDRYWSAIFSQLKPDPTRNKETRLGYGFGGADYSIVFVYDHLTGKSLCITGDFNPEEKNDYKNICSFAQFFEAKNILVAQFTNRLMMYLIDPETMEIKKTIDSVKSFDSYDRYFNKTIETVIFDKNGQDYLAYIDKAGDPSLIKFDWEKESMILDGLPGYMTTFGLIYGLFVKELGSYPIVVLAVSGKQKSDPDMGYSLFIQNGGGEGFNMYNFKNEFFQSWTPNQFLFSEPDENRYIQIDIYCGKLLLTKTVVPTNFDLTREEKKQKVA